MSEYFRVRNEPSEVPCAPYRALIPREREVLQLIADGLSREETAAKLGLSKSTVQTYTSRMGNLGLDGRNYYYIEQSSPFQTRTTILSLIQDGITNGYIHHDVPSSSVERLTPSQYEVAKSVMQGYSNAEIVEKLHIDRKTIESHLGEVYSRLGVANRYAMTARITYLQLAGIWERPGTLRGLRGGRRMNLEKQR